MDLLRSGFSARFPRARPASSSMVAAPGLGAAPSLWTGAWSFPVYNMRLWKLKVGIHSVTRGTDPSSPNLSGGPEMASLGTLLAVAQGILRTCPLAWGLGSNPLPRFPASWTWRNWVGRVCCLQGCALDLPPPQLLAPCAKLPGAHWPLGRPLSGTQVSPLAALDPEPAREEIGSGSHFQHLDGCTKE